MHHHLVAMKRLLALHDPGEEWLALVPMAVSVTHPQSQPLFFLRRGRRRRGDAHRLT